MQKEVEMVGKVTSSSHSPNSAVWENLWKLPIANAEKNFLWKACHDILPTRGNLRRRKIIEESKRPLCEREEETTAHILWFCPFAMDVWSAGVKTFQKCSYRDQNFL
jgi:hypothetical protein